MMNSKFLLAIAVVLLCLTYTDNIDAQTTHAEATSQKWQGIDVIKEVINSSNYNDDNTIESGYPFMLYNVGTGCFMIQGGDWAMEGRLFFSNFGREMYLYNNGRINGAITEQNTSNKNSFCARPPVPTGKSWADKDYKQFNFTTLFDGDVTWQYYKMNWHFERVEDPSNTDTYTYYMYQESTKSGSSGNYYLGAAWGECHNTSEGKGDGKFVFMDDDRSCWTTVDVRDENAIKAVPLWGTTTEDGVYLKQENGKAMLENGDLVDIQKLYQWRIISMEEFIDVLTQDGVGLNPSISSLITDRDFTRNSNDFFGKYSRYWRTSTLKGHTYGTGDYKKRYTYTWANDGKGQNQQRYTNRVRNESWDKPLRLKAAFDSKKTPTSAGDNALGKKNAKYSFLPFEGVGTITTDFQVPKPGWYQIECVGFSMSQNDHDAYFYARVIADTDTAALENNYSFPNANDTHYAEVVLEKLPFGTYKKGTYDECLVVGKELLRNANNHKQNVWVQVSQADWNAGTRTIRLGFRKEEATISAPVNYTYEETEYTGYYDTDWVCADDIRATYMGLAPVFFYEDEEDLNYLSQNPLYQQHFSSNEYVPTTLDGRYGGAAKLQRSFTVGEWNSFSFPLELTGEQVRNAFGEKSKLLRLHSIGGLSENKYIIDFESVSLVTLDNVVTPGNLYLLKPALKPSRGENPRGEEAEYYDLGKMFFSTNDVDENNPDYQYTVLDLNNLKHDYDVSSIDDQNDGHAYVSYVRTPGYTDWKADPVQGWLDSNGEYCHTADGSYQGTNKYGESVSYNADNYSKLYAPKGAYVMAGGRMYELNKDTRIKGFRGWITLTHSLFENIDSGSGVKMSIDGIVDGDEDITGIAGDAIPVPVATNTTVYDLCGRKVGTVGTASLPRGIYIVAGKKVFVK